MKISSFSLFFTFIFFAICILFEVYASDWDVYGNTIVNYSSVYYAREFVSWTIIDLLSYDNSSLANSLVSTLIFFLLVNSSYLIVDKVSKLISTKNNNLIFLSVTPFFFSNFYLLMSLNGLRQGLAIAFFLYSVYFLVSERKFASALFFFIAVFSHNATLFFLPAYIMVFGYFYRFYKIIPVTAFLILLLGSTIVGIAGKSSGSTTTSNSEAFLLVLLVVYSFIWLIFSATKVDRLKLGGNGKSWNKAFSYFLFYFPISVIGLYSDESTFERTIYFSMVLLICFGCGALSKFKQANWISLGMLILTPLVGVVFFSTSAIRYQFLLL